MGEPRARIVIPLGQIVLILMAILVVYMAVDFGRQVVVSHRIQGELRTVKSAVAAAKEKNARLQEALKYAQSDEAAEAWARQMGWVKSGEVLVQIVGPQAQPLEETQEAETRGAGTDAIRQEWLDLFFGGR